MLLDPEELFCRSQSYLDEMSSVDSFVGQQVLHSDELFRRPTASGVRPSFCGGQRAAHSHLYIATPLNGKLSSGGNTVSPNKYKGAIKIIGDSRFYQSIEKCLEQIEKTSAGKMLITELINKSKENIPVTIGKGVRNRAIPVSVVDGWKKGECIMYDHYGSAVTYGNKGTGKGCGTDIKLNFNYKFPDEKPFINMPRAIILAHELIHAYLFANGLADPTKKKGTREHEKQAIGVSPYNNSKITENKIRAQWKPPQPLRKAH